MSYPILSYPVLFVLFAVEPSSSQVKLRDAYLEPGETAYSLLCFYPTIVYQVHYE